MQPPRWQSEWALHGLSPRVRLAACLVVISIAWLGVLPLATRTPHMRGMIQRNESLGIDPSAKFYSELPVMPSILRRLERIRARDGAIALPDAS